MYKRKSRLKSQVQIRLIEYFVAGSTARAAAELLETQDMCVCEISHILGISQPGVSKHLRKLKDAGLVSCKKAGFWTDYSIEMRDDVQKKFLECALSQLDNDREVCENKQKLCKIDRKTLCECK